MSERYASKTGLVGTDAGIEAEGRWSGRMQNSMHRPVSIWGILNVTPDSFSDGGQFFDVSRALTQADVMLAAGADVIDVGGASSRPRGHTYGMGADLVPLEEEMRRVVPVIKGIKAEAPSSVVSIDTTSGPVAVAALEAGASIVNDVSMGRDPLLLEAVARSDAALVLMHTRGQGEVDSNTTAYDDVVEVVCEELASAVDKAVSSGVLRSKVWVDPGFGFAKTEAQSIELLGRVDEVSRLGCPVLVGFSRKGFLGRAVAFRGEVPGPTSRIGAAIAGLIWCDGRVDAVRVHDVEVSRQALTFWRTLRGGGMGVSDAG